MGQIISECLCIPQTNTFSNYFSSFPAINHSWLSELLFFQLSDSFGLTSLLYLKYILVTATFTIIFRLSLKKEALFTSILISLCAVAIFSQRFMVKPELFSYLFIAFLLVIFELYKRSRNVLFLWLIPPILTLWTNMHIFFFIGIVLFLFFIAEQIIVHKKNKNNLIPLTCCVFLSPLINPEFIRGAIYPFTVFQNYGISIAENQPTVSFLVYANFLSPQFYTIILFELLNCFAIVGCLIDQPKKSIALKLNTLLGIALGQIMIRCVAIFSLLGLPFLTNEYIFIREKAIAPFKKKFTYIFNSFMAILFIIILILQLTQLFTYQKVGLFFQRPADSAVNFLLKNNLHGPIFNNLTLGNYLIYRLYPKEKVFVDARPEAYPAVFLEDYQKMVKDNKYFDFQADKYKINIIFYNLFEYPDLSRKLILHLAGNNKWAPVFWDGNIVIFLRNNKANAQLISANQNVKAALITNLK